MVALVKLLVILRAFVQCCKCTNWAVQWCVCVSVCVCWKPGEGAGEEGVGEGTFLFFSIFFFVSEP